MPINIKIYLDSNVFISYVRQEVGLGFRQLGEESENFFTLCSSKGIVLVLSEMFFDEVEGAIGFGKGETVDAFKKLQLETESLPGGFKNSDLSVFIRRGVHRADAIYAHYATISGASCIVTWNKKHFTAASDLIKILTPEEFNGSTSQYASLPANPCTPA